MNTAMPSTSHQPQQQSQRHQQSQHEHSNDASIEIPRLLSALDAIYSNQSTLNNANNNTREAADVYLQSFQRHPASWQCCDVLLSTHPPTQPFLPSYAYFFAAQTLHSKCRRAFDLRQISTNSTDSSGNSSSSSKQLLKEGMANHLTYFASQSGESNSINSRAVTTQLGMALCSLAVQIGWMTIVTDLTQSVDFGLDRKSSCENPNKMNVFVALEILKSLPEECRSDRLWLEEEQDGWRFSTALRENSKLVLDFIWHCLTHSTNNNMQSSIITHTSTQSTIQSQSQSQSQSIIPLEESALKCFHSWIRYIDIPPTLLEQTPLIQWVFFLLHGQGAIDKHQIHSRDNHENPIMTHNYTNVMDYHRGDTFELAADVLVELLGCYPSHVREHSNLISKLIPLCMTLASASHSPTPSIIHPLPDPPFQQALHDEDFDRQRAYCRIFTEMGESYMSLLTGYEDVNQAMLLDLVLACSAIEDHEISTITLHFWYRFVSSLEQIEPYEYRQHQIDNYTPQLLQLVSTCTSLLQFPTNVQALSTDNMDDILNQRFHVSETLVDLCRLLGGNAVLHTLGECLQRECKKQPQTVQQQLSQQSQPPSSSSQPQLALTQWNGIESILIGMVSISIYVPSDEADIIPFVMSMIPRLPPTIAQLRHTSHQLVGKYACWLDRHGEYLVPLLPYLADGLRMAAAVPANPNHKEEGTLCAGSAAVAIKELCEGCRSGFALGDSALDLYNGILSAQVLSLKDELEVLEGVCKAVSRQWKEEHSSIFDNNSVTHNGGPQMQQLQQKQQTYLTRIVGPIGTRLLALADPTNIGGGGPKQAVGEVERLTVVARYLTFPDDPINHPSPSEVESSSPSSTTAIPSTSRAKFLTDLMSQSWNALEHVLQKYPNDFALAEKFCRLHKHVLRGCGPNGYKPMLEPFQRQLVSFYNLSHLSPYLYAASVLISDYGSYDDNASTYGQLFLEMLNELSNSTFTFLSNTNSNQFVYHPDVVEELFFLAGRMMTYCPQPLVLSPALLRSFVQCANVGMKLDHRDANRGTLNFLENLVSYGLTIESSSSSGTGGVKKEGAVTVEDPNVTAACKHAIENVFMSDGREIVFNLLQALMGKAPCYRVDSKYGSIAGILFKLTNLCKPLLIGWMQDALAEVSDNIKGDFLKDISGSTNVRDDFFWSVRRFHDHCLRISRRLEG